MEPRRTESAREGIAIKVSNKSNNVNLFYQSQNYSCYSSGNWSNNNSKVVDRIVLTTSFQKFASMKVEKETSILFSILSDAKKSL